MQMSPGHLERENGTKVLLGLKQRLASLSDTRDHSSCESESAHLGKKCGEKKRRKNGQLRGAYL